MLRKFSKTLDNISEFIAHRKGLLPIIGLMLISLNFLVQQFFSGWLVSSNLLLHAGIIISIVGLMLAWAL